MILSFLESTTSYKPLRILESEEKSAIVVVQKSDKQFIMKLVRDYDNEIKILKTLGNEDCIIPLLDSFSVDNLPYHFGLVLPYYEHTLSCRDKPRAHVLMKQLFKVSVTTQKVMMTGNCSLLLTKCCT